MFTDEGEWMPQAPHGQRLATLQELAASQDQPVAGDQKIGRVVRLEDFEAVEQGLADVVKRLDTLASERLEVQILCTQCKASMQADGSNEQGNWFKCAECGFGVVVRLRKV